MDIGMFNLFHRKESDGGDPAPEKSKLNFKAVYRVGITLETVEKTYSIKPDCSLFDADWDRMTEHGQREWLKREAIKQFIKECDFSIYELC